MRSPAEPASSLAFRAALYSVGADGENTTLMPGFFASKAGMIFSCQMERSSLRQLSTVSVTSSACAAPAMARTLVARSRPLIVLRVMSFSPFLRACAIEFVLSECFEGPAQALPRPFERRRRGARIRRPRRQQYRRLDRTAGARKQAFRLVEIDAGDIGDDARRPPPQLDIIRLEIDHMPVMDMAEMNADKRGKQIEGDLLRRARPHARRAGNHLRRRRQHNGRIRARKQRRAG